MAKHAIEVIAEIGINFQGDLDLAKTMICVAKCCGADTAKFQVYDPETTLDRNDPVLSPYWNLIMQTRLTKGQLRELYEACRREEIGFLASAFDVERVGWLSELGVERYKIASRSVNDLPLARAINITGKPALISLSKKYATSLPALMGITQAPHLHRYLYCVSEYPTPLAHLQFPGWNAYSSNGQGYGYTGFSDHTVGIAAAVVAMAKGATIIEKHFTLDKALRGPDHVCSATPQELSRLCQMRDDIEEILYAG